MPVVYKGDFQSGTYGALSFKIKSTTLPPLTLDEATNVSHGETGAAHAQVAGSRYTVGNFSMTVEFDSALYTAAVALLGTADGSQTAADLTLLYDSLGTTITVTIDDVVLANVTPSEVAVEGGSQPAIVLEFQHHAPTGVTAPAMATS